MKRRLTYIDPLRAGIVLAIFYGLLAIFLAPVFLLAAVVGSRGGGSHTAIGVGMAIFLPILYAGIGFVSGIIGAFLYNLVARWTGGFIYQTAEVEVSAPPAV